MPFELKPPYYGAAYYPEDWPESQIDEDIRLMKEAGMNVMRIAEFAWSRMEPEEGRFELDWLTRVIDKLGDAGIGVVMCTPGATPPVWAVERYPEILFVAPDGTKWIHGSRRHTCPNNSTYRRLCRAVVTELAKKFASHPAVIGWQIDNEVFPVNFDSRSCCCPVCQREFQEMMRQRFGSIEKLNEEWCNTLWSMEYQSFSQLPVPRKDVWHHPTLLASWSEFMSKSYIDFVWEHADVLREYGAKMIGTDMMMILGIDHYEMNLKMDVVQYNHYHFHQGLRDAAFWFDMLRPIKPNQPFWNTEAAPSWAGAITTSGYQSEGFCRANTWMPIIQGGEASMYWVWHSHRTGQEQMFGSPVTSCGRKSHFFAECQRISDGMINKAGEYLRTTKPTGSGLALHFSDFANIQVSAVPQVNGFDLLSKMLSMVYHPLIRSQFRPDVIYPVVELDAYKMILTPFLPWIGESGLQQKLHKWITDGGTWIVGPMSDVRDQHLSKFTHSPFGVLEEWTGVYSDLQIPGEPVEFGLKWQDGIESQGSVWFDSFQPNGAKVIASYTDGPFAGEAAIVEAKMGKGKIVLLGTMPKPEQLVKLVEQYGADCGVLPVAQASDSLLFVPRDGVGGEGFAAVEMDNKPATLTLSRPAVDLITGQTLSGTIDLPAYGVLVGRYL